MCRSNQASANSYLDVMSAGIEMRKIIITITITIITIVIVIVIIIIIFIIIIIIMSAGCSGSRRCSVGLRNIQPHSAPLD